MDDSDVDGGSRGRVRFIPSFLVFKQLYVLLWKNVYIKRLLRHYTSTLIEIAFIVALLSGIQEDSVTREPLVRRADTLYKRIRSDAFWNTQPDLANITKVLYYPARNRYLNRLTRDAFGRLGRHPRDGLGHDTSAGGAADTESRAIEKAADMPFDVQVNYRQRLISQPEGPVDEARFPEMHTLLPIMGALQQRHLELQAERLREPPPEDVYLRRFPFPAYIEHHDQKNYALVLTRFCIGMLIPFTVLVARLTDEKASW
ncbi:hypothetical protein MRX96_007950 [Rhipicephalus microplus]